MRSTNRLLVSAIILLLSDCIASQSMSEEERQCIENPTGAVSLNVDVRGVAGPEGPMGSRGPKGRNGEKGNRGLTGKKGDTGLSGEIGPVGSKGMQGEEGVKGGKGSRGIQGLTGPTGGPGLPGPQGVQGEPGDTQLNEEELDRVSEEVIEMLNASIIAELLERINKLEQKCMEKPGASPSRTTPFNEPTSSPTPSSSSPLPAISPTPEPGNTLCNVASPNWRRIAHFDTTLGDSCPQGLQTFIHRRSPNQIGCGTTDEGKQRRSLTFPSGGSYTQVCGKVRGYMSQNIVAFFNHGVNQTIDTNYVDGVSFTYGSPRQHLWTYAAGLSETSNQGRFACPCARTNYNLNLIPNFVGKHYFCESGFVNTYTSAIAWADPLWDGKGCTSGNACCQRYGWFHQQVVQTSEDIEVRWMKYYASAQGAQLLTDQLELWVM